jgi:hypothetical protein
MFLHTVDLTGVILSRLEQPLKNVTIGNSEAKQNSPNIKLNHIFMPFFKEEGIYCFAKSVGLSVGPSVFPPVDHMVSAYYLKIYLSQSLHISHNL